MAISNRDGEADRLAREVDRLTGETLTEAMGTALRERLERVRAQRDRARVARLFAIGERCAARMEKPASSGDHGALLYDERGLPR